MLLSYCGSRAFHAGNPLSAPLRGLLRPGMRMPRPKIGACAERATSARSTYVGLLRMLYSTPGRRTGNLCVRHICEGCYARCTPPRDAKRAVFASVTYVTLVVHGVPQPSWCGAGILCTGASVADIGPEDSHLAWLRSGAENKGGRSKVHPNGPASFRQETDAGQPTEWTCMPKMKKPASKGTGCGSSG